MLFNRNTLVKKNNNIVGRRQSSTYIIVDFPLGVKGLNIQLYVTAKKELFSIS